MTYNASEQYFMNFVGVLRRSRAKTWFYKNFLVENPVRIPHHKLEKDNIKYVNL